MEQQSNLKERVSHAYWKYGRFCSAHPVMTILTSIATIIFLSSPIVRLQLPASAPFETFLATNTSGLKIPDWFSKAEPFGYVQQIIVMTNSEDQRLTKGRSISASDSLKVPLTVAFDIHHRVAEFLGFIGTTENVCLPVGKAKKEFLPHSCLLLSPSLLWKNDRSELFRDLNVLNTIFDSDCNSEVCYKLLTFGIPLKMTGLNRHRRLSAAGQLNFAITLVLKTDEFRMQLKQTLNDLYETVAYDETAEMNVFYKSRKNWTEYIPLVLSYVVLFVYVYFSVSKIEMVKSKWGLAFSAVFTVASSLVMTAGICMSLSFLLAYIFI